MEEFIHSMINSLEILQSDRNSARYKQESALFQRQAAEIAAQAELARAYFAAASKEREKIYRMADRLLDFAIHNGDFKSAQAALQVIDITRGKRKI